MNLTQTHLHTHICMNISNSFEHSKVTFQSRDGCANENQAVSYRPLTPNTQRKVYPCDAFDCHCKTERSSGYFSLLSVSALNAKHSGTDLKFYQIFKHIFLT